MVLKMDESDYHEIIEIVEELSDSLDLLKNRVLLAYEDGKKK